MKRAEKQYKNAAQNAERLKQAQKDYDDDDDSWESCSSSDSTALTRRSPFKKPTWTMDQALNDVAVAHFMSSYVPGSYFDYLPQLYGKLGSTTVLPATIHAASIASLARDLGQKDIMKMARQSYAHALLETNTALVDPKTALDDATLVSVLLLTLFEAIVWESKHIPDNWTTHAKGALALVKLRGAGQFDTYIGRKLFTQVANITCVNSMRTRARLPQELADLVAAANTTTYESETPRYRLATMTQEVSHFLADLDEGLLTVQEVIDTATLIDSKYIAFCETFPPEWRYQEIRLTKRLPGVHGWTYHRYPNTRVAKAWNTTRMTRILLNEVRFHHSRKLDPSPYAMAVECDATATIQRMATDIAASIPQFTRPSSLADDDFSFPSTRVPDTWEHTMGDKGMSPKAAAAALMWPVSVIRSTSICSEDLREFAKEQLKLLGKTFHLPQAESVAMAGRDEDQDSLSNGLHMFYVS